MCWGSESADCLWNVLFAFEISTSYTPMIYGGSLFSINFIFTVVFHWPHRVGVNLHDPFHLWRTQSLLSPGKLQCRAQHVPTQARYWQGHVPTVPTQNYGHDLFRLKHETANKNSILLLSWSIYIWTLQISMFFLLEKKCHKNLISFYLSDVIPKVPSSGRTFNTHTHTHTHKMSPFSKKCPHFQV